MAVNTPVGTLSFPTLFTPRPRSEGGEPVFSCTVIFDEAAQKSPEFKKLQEAAKRAAVEKFGDKVNLTTVTMPFRDGAEKDYAGYGPGTVFISAWTKNRPGVVDGRLQEVVDESSVWAGRLGMLNVTPFAWTNSGRKGVSFGLNHAQVFTNKDTPRLDGRASASSVFAAVDGAEDSDSPF